MKVTLRSMITFSLYIYNILCAENGVLAFYRYPPQTMLAGYDNNIINDMKKFMETNLNTEVELVRGDDWNNIMDEEGYIEHPITGEMVPIDTIKISFHNYTIPKLCPIDKYEQESHNAGGDTDII